MTKAVAREKEKEKARVAAVAALLAATAAGGAGGAVKVVAPKAAGGYEDKAKSGKYWAKGTGYGHDAALDPSAPQWDPSRHAQEQVR